MTERVTIEGQGLTVTHDRHDPDPARKRPPRFAASVGDAPTSPSGWTLDEMIDVPNPFHPEPRL